MDGMARWCGCGGVFNNNKKPLNLKIYCELTLKQIFCFAYKTVLCGINKYIKIYIG